MKKRIAALTLILFLIIGTMPMPAFAEGLDNFQKNNTYKNQFTDVTSSQWYAASVREAYEYSLMNGTDTDKFAPGSYITIAQAITLASRLDYNSS